jgi:hypothetical protein
MRENRQHVFTYPIKTLASIIQQHLTYPSTLFPSVLQTLSVSISIPKLNPCHLKKKFDFWFFQILDFPGNPLVQLQNDVFHESNLLNLQEILMSRCRISQVRLCNFFFFGNVIAQSIIRNSPDVESRRFDYINFLDCHR